MKLNIYGSFLGTDGYSSHTRQLANALFNEGIDVCVQTNLSEGFEKTVTPNELKMLTSDKTNPDINLVIGLPNYWISMVQNDKPIIGFVVWEGDKVPKNWIETMTNKRIVQLWVPSIHVKDAIINTTNLVTDKIKIVPHGVNQNIFKCQTYLGKKDATKLVFLSSGGWPNGVLDRKGLSYLIKAYLEEFTSKEQVELIVKLNMSYGMNEQILQRNMDQLVIQNKDRPILKFITEMVPFNKLVEFYNMGNVYITTSMAEGFNLPVVEAMACGLPVVSTDFGGMTDVVNEMNGWLLKNGKMKEVVWDEMYNGVKWKVPSIKEIRKQLRTIYEHQGHISAKIGNALDTANTFTWSHSARKAKIFLNEFFYVSSALII